MKKRFFSSILMGCVASVAIAQVSNTLSPYSQFGLGSLADQSQVFNRGMGGIGIGLRGGQEVNMQNPASYSAVDSLSMIFDAGVAAQITNFKEGGKKVNARTCDFDYAVALFRVMPKMGVSVGIVPYSNIGYNYYKKEFIDGSVTNYATSTYSGTGGISQGYIGVGWEVAKGLSLGANVSYLWGNFTRTVNVTNSDSYTNVGTQSYESTISSYKLDFGAQYQRLLNKDNLLTVGATVGLGHKLGADVQFIRSNSNTQTGVTLSDTVVAANALALPFTIGVGASLRHKNSLTVGVDYSLQKWSSVDYPRVNSLDTKFATVSGLLSDRHRVAIGADWIPDVNSRRSYFKHVHYRIGAYYATPYYKIIGHDGPKELGLSAGFGLPIINSWNNRSVLNISAQWVRVSQPDFVTENTFRISIGLTFNERWFAKWKVD